MLNKLTFFDSPAVSIGNIVLIERIVLTNFVTPEDSLVVFEEIALIVREVGFLLNTLLLTMPNELNEIVASFLVAMFIFVVCLGRNKDA